MVVADDVGGHGGYRGAQGGAVGDEFVVEVDGGQLGQDVAAAVAGQPDQGAAVGEVDAGGIRADRGGEGGGLAGSADEEPLPWA